MIARSVARFYLPSCPINISIYQITNGPSLLPKKKKKKKTNKSRLCHEYLKDFDDFFFVLLITIIARSMARFYLLSCPINILIYVFLPDVTLNGILLFFKDLC